MTDAKLPGLEERFAEVKGVRMRYFVGGSGPPLVLVHGLGGAASNWAELVPLLTPRHRLLVPDLPGHGGSTALPAVSGLDPFADRVALVAESEGMLPAAIVGHSLGGMVVLRLALRRPDCVQALVLASAAGLSIGNVWGRGEELDPVCDDLHHAALLARVHPGAVPEATLDADPAPLDQIVGAELRLPIPDRDPEEVGLVL